MTRQPPKKSEQVRAFYDQAAFELPGLSLMNYGYAPASPSPGSDSQPEDTCAEMYRHVAQGGLSGKQVLEVSCGRGGGASVVMQACQPASLVGIDLSEKNIELARKRFGDVAGLEFRVGHAEELEFADHSFDAVLNVEASHLYDDHARFLAEVVRVLRPGGLFLYADLFWRDADPAALIAAAGFVVRADEDMTENVLRSLDRDSARREALIESDLPEKLKQDFRDWSGIKGYRAYNRFASGEWMYRYYQLERP